MEKWEREPLTDEEVRAIFDECSTTEERLIVAFLADTGCRVNELLRFSWSWVDAKTGKYGTLTVPVKATSGKRPKTKKPKTIPISKRLLGAMLDTGGVTPEVKIRRTPQHIYNVVKRLAKKAGITKHNRSKEQIESAMEIWVIWVMRLVPYPRARARRGA